MWRRSNCLTRSRRGAATNGGGARTHSSTAPPKNKQGKRIARSSFLSATLLTLSDGSAGGGWSTAVSLFRKASGLQHNEGTYSLSLGLLPLCLLYTGYGLINANDNNDVVKGNTTKEDGLMQSNPGVDWPVAIAFASSLITARVVPGWIQGDAKTLLPKHAIVRTASNGVFSLLVIGTGCVSLQRSYQEYKIYTEGDKIVEAQQLQQNGIDSSIIAKDGYDRSERIKAYAFAGGASGLGLFLLGPSALSIPVPLLVGLTTNNHASGDAGQSAGLSPRQAFDTVLECWMLDFSAFSQHSTRLLRFKI